MTETKRETLENLLARCHDYYPNDLTAEVRAWLVWRAADDDVREAVGAAIPLWVGSRGEGAEHDAADAAVAAFLGQVGA